MFDYFFLLGIYIIVSLIVIIKYYKRKNGIFQAPFLFSLSSVLMMTPQFSTIILNPYYDADLTYILSYVMITGTIAFAYGFDKQYAKSIYKCLDLSLDKAKNVFILFFIIGLYATIKGKGVWMNQLSGGARTAFIIYVNLANLLDLAFLYSVVSILRYKKFTWLNGIFIGSYFYYNFYTILMLARRNVAIRLFVILGFLYANFRPQFEKYIKIGITCFFIIGVFYSSSIGNIRSNLSGKTDTPINFKENFIKSFNSKDVKLGMDLGNGALGINYCYEHISYDLGFKVWNDFIQLFVPRFIVGSELKNSLKINFEHENYANNLCHGITTKTIFYDAFSAFSFFSFMMFYWIGWLLGYIWNRCKYSNYHLLLYLFLMTQIPNLASHGVGAILGRLELFIIIVIPVLWKYISTKMISYEESSNYNQLTRTL